METKRITRKIDLLSAVEQIVETAKGSGFSKEFFRKVERYTKYVSDKLKLTKEQSVFMALFVDNSNDTCISMSDFAKYVECRMVRIIRYMSDIDELERRELVRCNRDGRRISYRVPMEVIEAFKKDECYIPKDVANLSCQQLFGELDETFNLCDDNELTYEAVAEKVLHLLNSNKHLIFVQKVQAYDFDEEDLILLILFCHLFVNKNDDNICYHDLNFLYDKKCFWLHIKSQLESNVCELQREKLIEYNNDGGFVNRESFRLTHKAKEEFFSEIHIPSMNVMQKRGDLINAEKITEKRLFYDKKVEAQIGELNGLLDEVHYQSIRSRLQERGFRCGFTCLFYGAPGTGKTETVLQLARSTGRDIMQVNVSEIKSMWVGESEKNIKGIFDSYRKLVKEYRITPILLFNEADAIIGRRQEGAERAVEKMENSIQNIILQEMETLDGILIATTNLAQNMDKAFERRFLYKIQFTQPSIEARMAIWKTMIPALSDSDIHVLAKKYDFSGGQIENIARHYAIDSILHGEHENGLDTLLIHCNNEKLEKKALTRRIGF